MQQRPSVRSLVPSVSSEMSSSATRVNVRSGPAPGSKQPNPKSAFFSQTIPAWTPILTPFWIYAIMLTTGLVFLAIGIALKVTNDAVVELRVQYDGSGKDVACSAPQAGGAPTSCTLSFTAPSDMKAPVFVYYQLTNFYQNHRRYVQSRSAEQLAGSLLGASSLSLCSPLITAANGKVLHPCGLIANSFFNDTFCPAGVTCCQSGLTCPDNSMGWTESDISWSSDRTSLFKPIAAANPASAATHQFLSETYPNLYCGIGPTGLNTSCDPLRPLDVDNEHFIVWMRPAALPDFRKLYGRFTKDIAKGTTVTFNVRSAFPVMPFSGTKALVMSTVSWAGGKNAFLGVAYLVVGSLSIALAAAFWVRQNVFKGRELGDASSLAWASRR